MPEFSPEELEHAKRIADRLMGRRPMPAGAYVYGKAGETLEIGDMVETDLLGNFFKSQDGKIITGVVISRVYKNNYAWIIAVTSPLVGVGI